MKRKKFRRYRGYPRRRYRAFRRGKAPIPLAPILGGIVAPVMDSAQRSNFINDIQTNPMQAIQGMTDQICQHYIGISPIYHAWDGFNAIHVIPTYTGLFAGMAAHWAANKFGLNRAMKRVPFLGKYVQI